MTDATGRINKDKSAETPQRGWWKHWAAVLEGETPEAEPSHDRNSFCRPTRRTGATPHLDPAALGDPSAAALVDPALVAFIYHEARLADEARYSEWEALWDDDARVLGADGARTRTRRRTVSYINDNRTRIRSRVAQLNTGVRHSQTPPSVLRRTVSNFEVTDGTTATP